MRTILQARRGTPNVTAITDRSDLARASAAAVSAIMRAA
jgi:hypothetical protein